MRLERLRRVGIAGLTSRARQEAAKVVERVRGTPDPDKRRRRMAELHEVFRAADPERFFAGATSPVVPALFAERWPQARAELIAAAEAACRGEFDLLGYRALRYGDPPDWHFDPVSGRHAPLRHWSRVRFLDREEVGDSKVVWELNRHQWFVTLGQAYRLTGDERYAAYFARCARDWLRANPPGMGINWASSLEVALRIVSWSWALFLFRGSSALSDDLTAELVEGIDAHASHVERYLSHSFSPNTHLTGEALGLVYAGILLPGLARSRRRLERGSRILAGQIARQVLADGIYFEQSTCYQRYSIEIGLHFLMLAARNRLAVPDEPSEGVDRMLDALLLLRGPDGRLPAIGDADGGWLLPLERRAPDDPRGVFATAAALLERPDCAWAAGGAAPEALWLLGPSGLRWLEEVTPSPPEGRPSHLLPQGGYAVMASGWEPEAHHLIFDVGPLGCTVSAGHGHADLLSVILNVFGQPCIVDAGTGVYTADAGWRDHFRSTWAHSTITVDGTSQAEPNGPFAWKARPGARLRRWLSTASFDFADAEHDAYRRLPDPVVHRRRVAFVKPRYFVVLDELEGNQRHCVQLRYQLASRSEVEIEPGSWLRVRLPRAGGLRLRSFASVPLAVEVLEGKLEPSEGWLSPDYGRRETAPVIVCATETPLPLRILTLLLPFADATAGPPSVCAVSLDEAGPVGLAFGDGERVVFDAMDLMLTRP